MRWLTSSGERSGLVLVLTTKEVSIISLFIGEYLY